ncbi:amidohydrolase [Sporolactobacillus inulinus]|uniref:N-acetyl-L,l-diaminopimelate deacetylase homolog n=1 Tax=Sporolactobacillus inulinus TaxID=2078 RepID=A0A4Y1ZG20_9BACL|nr:N-acetyl-L,l-diaminopimelate deacetylase homolog [Sporolactobacillus inulinus]GEB77228.1 hydrolase [Sporolactobacillus inulinus]
MPNIVTDTELEQKLIDCRRQLHEHPELSFEEYETTKALSGWLNEAGVETLELPLETGVLAVIRGAKPGPVICLRTDIDALPIQEETGLPFASKVPGKMHACGHDFHTVSILGATLLLNERKAELEGTVKVIFQPAEENGNGALKVLETGVLDDVQAIFGMHDMPHLPTGTIGIKPGPLMAAVDKFTIDVEGIGTHAAAPEKGIDSIVVASHIITALQTIVARNVSPLNNAVISVTRLEAGNTWNVLPQTAQMEGTVRTFQEHVRDGIPAKMQRVVEGVAAGLGAKGTLHFTKLGPATINNEKLAEWSIDTAKASGLNVITPTPSTAGEDFAEYMKKIPGAFYFMGVSGTSGLHHPDLIIDEKAILPSAKFFANLAIDMVKKVRAL